MAHAINKKVVENREIVRVLLGLLIIRDKENCFPKCAV